MSENTAKIKISIKDGEFEITGSELFVSQQIANFKEQIVQSLQNKNFENPKINTQRLPEAQHKATEKDIITDEIDNENKYERVLYLDDESIKILKKLPGKSNQARTISTALVSAFGNLLRGNEETLTSIISEQCKEQGCLDSANFASHLKSAKEYFIIKGGSGTKNKALKLTITGKEEAEKILNELNGN